MYFCPAIDKIERQSIIFNKILKINKQWKEHFNLQREKEEINTDSENVWQLPMVEKYEHAVALKDAKNLLYPLSQDIKNNNFNCLKISG